MYVWLYVFALVSNLLWFLDVGWMEHTCVWWYIIYIYIHNYIWLYDYMYMWYVYMCLCHFIPDFSIITVKKSKCIMYNVYMYYIPLVSIHTLDD